LNSSFIMETIVFRDDVEDEQSIKKITASAARKKIRVEVTPEKSFKNLSETENSQGIVAVVKKTELKREFHFSGNVVVALERISDPGNLGTIIRTCHWFGVKTVLISKDSVDLYNSKVIRSTQGSLFHVNISDNLDLGKSLKESVKSGYSVYLLDPKSKQSIEKASEKSIFVFGSESEGISEELKSEGFQTLAIKGYSNCESLNVAVSCGIVLNEII